jgi:hypothetical protein
MEDVICYECIVCGIQWGPGPSDHVSHGLCLGCIRTVYVEKIRAEQLKYSGVACFLYGYDWCKENDCRYRSACLDEEYEKWKETILNGGDKK